MTYMEECGKIYAFDLSKKRTFWWMGAAANRRSRLTGLFIDLLPSWDFSLRNEKLYLPFGHRGYRLQKQMIMQKPKEVLQRRYATAPLLRCERM